MVANGAGAPYRDGRSGFSRKVARSMTDRLKGKFAFCTASGAGIGRATALAFARAGARVVASDLNEAAMAGLGGGGAPRSVSLEAGGPGGNETNAKPVGPAALAFQPPGLLRPRT